MESKIILWGIGKHCFQVMKEYLLPIDCIEAVIDSNPQNCGNYFGCHVGAPSLLKECTSSIVVVGSKKFYDEIVSDVLRFSDKFTIILLDEFIKKFPKVDTVASFFAWKYLEDRMRTDIKSLIEHMKRIGELPIESFKDAKLFANRTEMLKVLPKNGVVAEIGVAYGGFSDEILKHLQPKHFYAIDYFNKENPYISFWGHTYFEDSGMTHEEWYCNKYHDLIESGKMTVCSGMSWDEMEKFDDNFFDYIYIDAGHDYTSVKKDIAVAIKKIKANGYIQFNDYTLQSIEGTLGACYGIVPAVNEMIIMTKSCIVGFGMQLLNYCDLIVRVNK